MESVEASITEWRTAVSRGADPQGVDELEAHLRDQMAELTTSGLADDEAFLVAVRRIGAVDELTREFAREHSGRTWRQLILAEPDDRAGTGLADAITFSVAAAVTIQIARIAAGFPALQTTWLERNLGVLVLPFLAGFLVRRRRLGLGPTLWTAGIFATTAVVINVYPYAAGSTTEVLVALHLPVLLWLVVAVPYTGGRIGSHEARMDFVRFTGEWFIYYVLIALGGSVLVGLTALVVEPTGLADPETLFLWVVPSGAAGAVVIAAWLVESKQRVIENMAPVLTMVFTPLFAVMLIGNTIAYAAVAFSAPFDRDRLSIFDALLVVVFGLVIYGISARDPATSANWMDRIQLVLVASAVALDAIVLTTMIARIGDLGFTANRTAALGLNVLLLVGLARTARLSWRFVTGHGTFHRLERWQTDQLPGFAAWAALVVLVLPPLFRFG